MLNDYKAVFFDAGGTLLHPYPSVGEIYSTVAIRYGVDADPAKLNQIFKTEWLKRDGLSTLDSHSNEKIEKQWWRSLVEDVFKQVATFDDFDAYFEELFVMFGGPDVWRLYPDTSEVLKTLKEQGKYLSIISNWDSRLLQLCKGFGLDQYFEHVTISAVFGAAKPSPKIFEEALRLSGVDASEAIHIGDSLEDDIRGAQSLGVDSVLINRHPDRHEVHGEQLQDIKVIHELSELIR